MALETPEKGVTPAPSDSDVELTSVNEKSLLRKLDARLLPAVSILYLLSFLDRSNGTLALRSTQNSAMLMRNSRKRSHRRPHNRPPHDRQPIPHRPNALFRRLRPLRTPLQHRAQAHESEVLAAHADDRVGRCSHIDGCDAELGWVFRCAILVRSSLLQNMNVELGLTK
jgi:hypothetical protein